jgi:HlyD family secretion protein
VQAPPIGLSTATFLNISKPNEIKVSSKSEPTAADQSLRLKLFGDHGMSSDQVHLRVLPPRVVRAVVVMAMLLAGASYVFRHSLFPSELAVEVMAETADQLPMSITIVTAVQTKIARRIVAGGTLVARDEVLIVSQLQGVKVESYTADVGDKVTKGQPMAMLDSQRIDLQLSQKTADLARAEAMVSQAKAQSSESEAAGREADLALQRARLLRKGGTVSALTLQERVTAAAIGAARFQGQSQALVAAKADLARVKAEFDELLWQRDQIVVVATVTGVVSERSAKIGQTIAGDGAPLYRILKDGEVEMEALVIETALPAIEVGQSVAVTIAGAETPIEGKVRLVSPQIDPATRMGKIWISLASNTTRPGNFASAVFNVDRHEGIVLPRMAVMQDSDGARVQIVENGVVHFRNVTIGLMDASGVEIVTGLNSGEAVVAVAGGFLREGSLVTPAVQRSGSEDGGS